MQFNLGDKYGNKSESDICGGHFEAFGESGFGGGVE